MLTDVTVAWDGSERSRAALDWVLRRKATGSVQLVRVLAEEADDYDIEAACRLLLDGETERIRARRSELIVSSEIVHGDVEQELLRRALPGRLLVLGTGGAAALRLPHRSAMLARLARLADGPITLVPLQGGAATGPVLAGVDGTAAGAAAAQIAATEADSADTSLVLVQVEGDHLPPGTDVDACTHVVHHRFPRLLVRQRLIRGDARRELIQSAGAASLLVLGHHDAAGPGSAVEQHATWAASCPLLLVREAEASWLSDVGAVPARAVG